MAVFLQALHAWAAALKGAGKPGRLHRCVAEFAIAMLNSDPSPIRFHAPLPGEAATDASATSAEAVVGGWACLWPPVKKTKALWFCITLDLGRFWWVWSRAGDPRRVIGALELLAHVFWLRMLEVQARGRHIRSRLGISTDNEGNAYATMKENSRKLPAAAPHMELAAVESSLGLVSEVSHVRREHNTWAGQLTHPEELSKGGWNPSCRWKPTIDSNFFLVLDKVLDVWTSAGMTPVGGPSGSIDGAVS